MKGDWTETNMSVDEYPNPVILDQCEKPSPTVSTGPEITYVHPPINQTTSKRDRLKETASTVMKKVLVFLISQVGLTCLVVGYAIMGGFIFMTLEGKQEVKTKTEVKDVRKDYVKALWVTTTQFNVLFEPNWTAHVDAILQRFQSEIYDNIKESGWDGSDSEEVKEWTYAGSLLYSVTVITTIGYGHLTPRTLWGRLVTMLYALIGIPMTLLCLANIGSFLAKCFRLFWSKVLCRLCTRTRPRRAIILKKKSNKDGSNMHANDLNDDSKEVSEYTSERERPVRIPIIVCLLLMAGYIFLGAMLFTLWEPEWDYLEGSYFCFITLSTIGFGDYVPGHTHASWDDQAKRVSCSLYLLFGLALISMCFDLMQSEVREICREIALAMGISMTHADHV